MNPDSLDRSIRSLMRQTHASTATRQAMAGAFAQIDREAARSGATSSNTAHYTSYAQPSRRSALWGMPRWAQVCGALVAVLLCTGGTAFAAVQLGLIKLEPQGAFQTALSINTGASTAASQGAVADYRLQLTNLPADAVPVDQDDHVQKWNWANGTAHVSSCAYYLDTADALPVSFLTGNEPLTVNGREGVLLETSRWGDDNPIRELYVVYPDEQRVVWLWSDSLDSASLQQIAEGVQLVPNGKMATPGESGPNQLLLWSDIVNHSEAVENLETEELWLNATNQDMITLHKTGEAFAITTSVQEADGSYTFDAPGIQACVANVSVGKSMAQLSDANQIPATWMNLLQADDTLGNAELKYLRRGDGKTTLDEVLATRSIPVSLVEVTVEYTNTTNRPIYDALVFGSLVRASQGSSSWSIYQQESLVDGAEAVVSSIEGLTDGDVRYLTIGGAYAGEKNHLSELKPGESATVTMAWIVPDEELDKLLLNVSSYGGDYQFTQDALNLGYVDIRQ